VDMRHHAAVQQVECGRSLPARWLGGYLRSQRYYCGLNVDSERAKQAR
jgi:hypothetical protein